MSTRNHPLQNRVTPSGELVAIDARGRFMGNRGVLHNSNQEIVRKWKTNAWITCQLKYKERKRAVFGPNSYSELFFLDEATAFSAGHRPCGECRRARYKAFKAAWLQANRKNDEPPLSLAEIDRQLHLERITQNGEQVTFEAEWGSLPEGIFIKRDNKLWLYKNQRLNEWSHDGYKQWVAVPAPTEIVTVLTPRSIVRVFAQGFEPELHPSIDAVFAD